MNTLTDRDTHTLQTHTQGGESCILGLLHLSAIQVPLHIDYYVYVHYLYFYNNLAAIVLIKIIPQTRDCSIPPVKHGDRYEL